MNKIKQVFCEHRWVRRHRQHMTQRENTLQELTGQVRVPWRCKDCNKEIVTLAGDEPQDSECCTVGFRSSMLGLAVAVLWFVILVKIILAICVS